MSSCNDDETEKTPILGDRRLDYLHTHRRVADRLSFVILMRATVYDFAASLISCYCRVDKEEKRVLVEGNVRYSMQ